MFFFIWGIIMLLVLHGLPVRSNAELAATKATANSALNIANQAKIKADENASANYHELKSYIWAKHVNNIEVLPNVIVSGSLLRMAGGLVAGSINAFNRTWSFDHQHSIALPGSWKCMGYINNSGININAISGTLFTRVA